MEIKMITTNGLIYVLCILINCSAVIKENTIHSDTCSQINELIHSSKFQKDLGLVDKQREKLFQLCRQLDIKIDGIEKALRNSIATNNDGKNGEDLINDLDLAVDHFYKNVQEVLTTKQLEKFKKRMIQLTDGTLHSPLTIHSLDVIGVTENQKTHLTRHGRKCFLDLINEADSNQTRVSENENVSAQLGDTMNNTNVATTELLSDAQIKKLENLTLFAPHYIVCIGDTKEKKSLEISHDKQFVRPFMWTIQSDVFIANLSEDLGIETDKKSRLVDVIKRFIKCWWICEYDFAASVITEDPPDESIRLYVQEQYATYRNFRLSCRKFLSEKQLRLFQERLLQNVVGVDYNTLCFYFLDSLNVTENQLQDYQECIENIQAIVWQLEKKLKNASSPEERHEIMQSVKLKGDIQQKKLKQILTSNQFKELERIGSMRKEKSGL